MMFWSDDNRRGSENHWSLCMNPLCRHFGDTSRPAQPDCYWMQLGLPWKSPKNAAQRLLQNVKKKKMARLHKRPNMNLWSFWMIRGPPRTACYKMQSKVKERTALWQKEQKPTRVRYPQPQVCKHICSVKCMFGAFSEVHALLDVFSHLKFWLITCLLVLAISAVVSPEKKWKTARTM